MSAPAETMLRRDTATALRRFWHLERALILACGGWVSCVGRLETKAALAEVAWESSLIADALRRRVFELRYPDRALEREPDAALVSLFESVVDAPDARSFLSICADHLIPTLGAAYDRYLQLSDEIADGPTYRFLRTGRDDKERHAALLRVGAEHEPASAVGREWTAVVARRLEELGGVAVESSPPDLGPWSAPGIPHTIPDEPVRDERYLNGLFYWPDNFDPGYPYGEGTRLQLRTAVSHLNEVWAVETAGAILFDLGPSLGWDFVMDAARWLYDESRHMTMGRLRLARWGFEPGELPLGTFIYGSCAGKPSLYRLGMLAFFETKNIGKKAERAEAFGTLGDHSGQRDMEFDWADEAIHAGYGRRWLREAMSSEKPEREWTQLLADCEALVRAHVASATEADRETIRTHAQRMIDKAEATSVLSDGGP